ncbi:PIN domain-containing protein [Patescibacteria group bacterium]|nr:PIN domain-containing protein [Patescibacteria group bacterium]
MVQRFYLDTSVFIAEFDKKSNDHKILTEFIKVISNDENTEFCFSKWCITEMYNRLTKNQIDELKIVKYIKNLLDINRLRQLYLKLIDVSPNKKYDFNLFFNDLTKDLIKYKTGKNRPGLGDIIHVRVMKNNRINKIITFDSDFENIAGFTTLNLRKIDLKKLKEDNKKKQGKIK